jgi:hypothetical protein
MFVGEQSGACKPPGEASAVRKISVDVCEVGALDGAWFEPFAERSPQVDQMSVFQLKA